MKNKTITLNRNKIEEIGAHLPEAILKLQNKKTNEIIYTFEVYKVIRRKQKLYCHAYNGRLTLNFKNIQFAKKNKKLIQEYIK